MILCLWLAEDDSRKPNADAIRSALDEAQRPDAEIGEEPVAGADVPPADAGGVDADAAAAGDPDAVGPEELVSSEQRSSQGDVSSSSGSPSRAKPKGAPKKARLEGPETADSKAKEKQAPAVEAAAAPPTPRGRGRGRGRGAKTKATEAGDEPASSSALPKSAVAKVKGRAPDASRHSDCIIQSSLHTCGCFCELSFLAQRHSVCVQGVTKKDKKGSGAEIKEPPAKRVKK